MPSNDGGDADLAQRIRRDLAFLFEGYGATVSANTLEAFGNSEVTDEAAIASLMTSSPQSTKQPTKQKQPPHGSSPNVFEDDRIRVGIPVGWSVQPATETVTRDRTYQLPIGALLTKGRYKLYLLSYNQQASGVEGGRFSEVVKYVSPWIDMSESPWLPCPAEGTDTGTNNKLSRMDSYFDTTHAGKKALVDCGNPTVKGTLWYGSYFVENLPSQRLASCLWWLFSCVSGSFWKASAGQDRRGFDD